MKNLHFCTKHLIRMIKYSGNRKWLYIKTYRTGYVPSFRTGEVIRMNERIDKKDFFLKSGKIWAVFPIQYRDIPLSGKYEILESYKKRKFHPEHWFFEIVIRKWSMNHGKIYEDVSITDLAKTIKMMER